MSTSRLASRVRAAAGTPSSDKPWRDIVAKHELAGDPSADPYDRRVATAHQAVGEGLFEGDKTEQIGCRVTRRLLEKAKASTGLSSHTQLLEYALAKVALEDDFGRKLVARKGVVPDDVDL